MKNYEELLLWTREAQERSCQVARCFQQRGYKKGDLVALGTLILGGGWGGQDVNKEDTRRERW